LKKLAGYVIGDGASANTKASYVRQLAPLHGTIVRDHTTELIREYNEWTDKQIAVRAALPPPSLVPDCPHLLESCKYGGNCSSPYFCQ
jgi:hypothetical protein